jgi:myosin heavy subunit
MKLILQFLSEISGRSGDFEQQILEANPIMEAFGNSKTIRNDNSSRFGKWIEIYFDDAFKICHLKLTSYMLEAIRVTKIAADERNYHIFYQLISSSYASSFELDSNPRSYRYLNQSKEFRISGRSDEEDFRDTCRALSVLNFSGEEQQRIFEIVALILHLGNIEFKATCSDSCEILDAKRDLMCAARI